MRCCSILTNELAGTLAQGPRKSRKQTMRDTHCNPYAQFFLCEPDCNRSGICEYTTGRMPEIRGVISVYDFSSPRPPIHWRFFSSQTKGKQKMKKNINWGIMHAMGQIAASNSHNFDNDITYCYIPSGTQINDATGAFECTSNCRYSE